MHQRHHIVRFKRQFSVRLDLKRNSRWCRDDAFTAVWRWQPFSVPNLSNIAHFWSRKTPLFCEFCKVSRAKLLIFACWPWETAHKKALRAHRGRLRCSTLFLPCDSNLICNFLSSRMSLEGGIQGSSAHKALHGWGLKSHGAPLSEISSGWRLMMPIPLYFSQGLLSLADGQKFELARLLLL